MLKLIALDQRGAANGEKADALYSVRGLAGALGVSKSEISNSINRLYEAGLALKVGRKGRPKAIVSAAQEFIVSGLKYVFPVKPGPQARGVPTAFAAPVLENRVMSAGEGKFVWPDAEAKDSGQSIEPLFKSVPFAIRDDPQLYAYLALVDAIRLGNAREASIAKDELKMRLDHHG